MAQQHVADGGVGHVLPPLNGDPAQQGERPEGPNRRIENPQQEPQRQGVFHESLVGIPGDKPRNGKGGVGQDRDVEIVKMFLVVEQQQMLCRIHHIREGQAVYQLQVDQLIAERPEEKGGEYSG